FHGREYLHPVFDGIRGSFQALAFDNRILGIVLMVAFVVHLAWRCREGLHAALNALAWTAALIAWWGLACISRGSLATPDAIRYVFPGSVFILLALIPVKPLTLSPRLRSPLAAGALVVIGALIVLVVHGPIADAAQTQRQIAIAAKRTSAL